MTGERCNSMGFAKFKKLVDAYKWETAMEASTARGIPNEPCIVM